MEHMLTGMVGIPCTHDFDDFTFIGHEAIMPDVIEMAKDLMTLLGWRMKGGDKDEPLAHSFEALGVVFDLSEIV